MERGMSKDNKADTRSKERKEVEEWMYGSGSVVMGGGLIILVVGFVVFLFI